MPKTKLTTMHFNLINYGGAYIAASRIVEALDMVGHESELIALNGEPGSLNSVAVRVGSKLDFEAFSGDGSFSYFKTIGYRLDKKLDSDIKLANLIHLHWLPGHLNSSSRKLFGMSQVVTLHDMNFLTGGCHYSLECMQYLENCKSCPVSPRLLQTLVRKEKEKKKDYLQANGRIFVAPSKWLATSYNNTFPDKPNCEVIRNPVSTSYREIAGAKDSKVKSSNLDCIVLIYGQEYDNIKGSVRSRDLLIQAISQLQDYKVGVVSIGKAFPEIEKYLVKEVALGSDEKTIQEALKLSDIFLYTSKADNYPNIILEASACGNAIVALNHGGVSETFLHSFNGYQCENDQEVIRHLVELISDPIKLREFQNSSRRMIIANNDPVLIGNKYSDLYSKITNQPYGHN